jgi:hypothetical protein
VQSHCSPARQRPSRNVAEAAGTVVAAVASTVVVAWEDFTAVARVDCVAVAWVDSVAEQLGAVPVQPWELEGLARRAVLAR